MGPLGRFTPSATRPASSAIFGPKPPMTTGGGGSGRRNPLTPPTVPDHTDRSVTTAASTACRRAASPGTGRSKARCSAAYGVSRPPPAPRPSRSRPSLTSCRVAAITPRVPAGRLATLRTMGPMAIRGTVAAIAVKVVHASSTRFSLCTDPARWSYSHTPSKPSPSAALAASCTSVHVAPNGSNNRSVFITLMTQRQAGETGGGVTGGVGGRHDVHRRWRVGLLCPAHSPDPFAFPKNRSPGLTRLRCVRRTVPATRPM